MMKQEMTMNTEKKKMTPRKSVLIIVIAGGLLWLLALGFVGFVMGST